MALLAFAAAGCVPFEPFEQGKTRRGGRNPWPATEGKIYRMKLRGWTSKTYLLEFRDENGRQGREIVSVEDVVANDLRVGSHWVKRSTK